MDKERVEKDDLPDAEIAERFEATVRRMANTKPAPKAAERPSKHGSSAVAKKPGTDKR